MGSFDNTGRVISESLVAQKAHTLSIARKGERKLCSRLVVKVDSRVILSSVVGSGEDATAGYVASTLNIFFSLNPNQGRSAFRVSALILTFCKLSGLLVARQATVAQSRTVENKVLTRHPPRKIGASARKTARKVACPTAWGATEHFKGTQASDEATQMGA